MTCIKTGAVVDFVDYEQILSADLYAVGDAIVIRSNADALENGLGINAERVPTHRLHSSPSNTFWRDDLGVFVVPKEFIKEL